MKQKWFLYFYYALLLFLLASRQSATTAPSMVLRIAFIAAVIIPALLSKEVCYPAIITMFYTISISGFAYSYFPYTFILYVIITILITIYLYRKNSFSMVPPWLLLFAFYFLFIDIISNVESGTLRVQNTVYCLLMIGCFLIIIGREKISALSQLPLCFAITTIVLSIAFFTNREQYILTEIGDMERTGWTDPNYFGITIGMGTIIGMKKMLGGAWKNLNIIEKSIFIAAVTFSVPVLVLNASRGAILSVVVGVVTVLLLSKAKFGWKILFTISALVAIVYLYRNQYFDLLEYRIMNDDGTGSSRTEIWAAKISAFASGSPLKMILGYGHEAGSSISGYAIGFHNDFIGFLVDYGIIGLGMLLYMLYYPIKLALKGSLEKQSVIVLIMYLVTCMMTLEPLLMGSLVYYVFYMYALLLAKKSKETLIV